MKLLVLGVLTLFELAGCQFTSKDESDNIAYQSFEIYRKIFNSSTNLVYSPLSFRVLYSILYQTSFGETENELRNQLFANNTRGANKRSLQTIQSTILDRILSSDNLKLANKVYLAEGSTLNQDFASLVAQYKSEVEQVDFNKSKEVADKMNQWIGEHTNYLINNFISEDSVSPDARLFLINTLYFNSNWQSPFNADRVSKSVFYNIDGSKSEIEFIEDENFYRVGNVINLNVDVLELPYEGKRNFKFWILLPLDGLGLDELKSQLTPDFIHTVNNSISMARAQIKFPIFAIEYEIDGTLISDVLFKQAELNILDNSGPLRVDAIKQKVKLNVNTEGTEATAATYVQISLDILSDGKPRKIIVDRPFVFAVLTQDCNEPIFVGHYVNANKS